MDFSHHFMAYISVRAGGFSDFTKYFLYNTLGARVSLSKKAFFTHPQAFNASPYPFWGVLSEWMFIFREKKAFSMAFQSSPDPRRPEIIFNIKHPSQIINMSRAFTSSHVPNKREFVK